MLSVIGGLRIVGFASVASRTPVRKFKLLMKLATASSDGPGRGTRIVRDVSPLEDARGRNKIALHMSSGGDVMDRRDPTEKCRQR